MKRYQIIDMWRDYMKTNESKVQYVSVPIDQLKAIIGIASCVHCGSGEHNSEACWTLPKDTHQ